MPFCSCTTTGIPQLHAARPREWRLVHFWSLLRPNVTPNILGLSSLQRKSEKGLLLSICQNLGVYGAKYCGGAVHFSETMLAVGQFNIPKLFFNIFVSKTRFISNKFIHSRFINHQYGSRSKYHNKCWTCDRRQWGRPLLINDYPILINWCGNSNTWTWLLLPCHHTA